MFCFVWFLILFLINSAMQMTKLWADASLILAHWHHRMLGALRGPPDSSSHQGAAWPPAGGGTTPTSGRLGGRSAAVKPQVSLASCPAAPSLMRAHFLCPGAWKRGEEMGCHFLAGSPRAPEGVPWSPQDTTRHCQRLQDATGDHLR